MPGGTQKQKTYTNSGWDPVAVGVRTATSRRVNGNNDEN